MTDFFSRIASRELGVAPVVQPVIGSRYAPTADLAAPPPGTSFAADRSNTMANPAAHLAANSRTVTPAVNPAEPGLRGESLSANSLFSSSSLLTTDPAELSLSSSALNDVETAVPATAQPNQSQLNIQTSDAIAEGFETGERPLADSRATTSTRPAASAPRDASEGASTFAVRERKTNHTDFELRPAPLNDVGASSQHENVSAESETLAERESAIAEHEPVASERENAEFELEEEIDTVAEFSRSRAESTVEARPISQRRRDVELPPAIATRKPRAMDESIASSESITTHESIAPRESIASREEEAPESSVGVRPTLARDRDAVRRDAVETWLVAGRGADDLQPTGRLEPTNLSGSRTRLGPTNPSGPTNRSGPTNLSESTVSASTSLLEPTSHPEPTIQVRATWPATRRGVDPPVNTRGDEVGEESVTDARPASPPARAVVDSRATADRQYERREQTANASHGLLVMKDAVNDRTIARTEEDAASSTIQVRSAAPLQRATTIAAHEAERSEPLVNSKSASQFRQDALSSRSTVAASSRATASANSGETATASSRVAGALGSPSIAKPEDGRSGANGRRATNDSQSPSQDRSQRAASTASLRAAATDHESAREKKQAPDARSNQHRMPTRRDANPTNQSITRDADESLRSSPLRSSINSEPRAASEKIIRVTIGRIEVHAAPPVPPPVEAPAPPAPQMSLDEFLRQHNGRRQ